MTCDSVGVNKKKNNERRPLSITLEDTNMLDLFSKIKHTWMKVIFINKKDRTKR